MSIDSPIIVRSNHSCYLKSLFPQVMASWRVWSESELDGLPFFFDHHHVRYENLATSSSLFVVLPDIHHPSFTTSLRSSHLFVRLFVFFLFFFHFFYFRLFHRFFFVAPAEGKEMARGDAGETISKRPLTHSWTPFQNVRKCKKKNRGNWQRCRSADSIN